MLSGPSGIHATSPVAPPWTTWWQTDLPSQFSPERARENADFLVGALGSEWLRRATSTAGDSAHPIARAWMQNGANAFFDLNSLAEDLRHVIETPGIKGVVADLRRKGICQATWHAVHVAALLTRDPGQRLLEFYDQDDQSKPDFRIEIDNEKLAVEAKRFYPSLIQERFETFATPVCETIVKTVLPASGIQPVVVVAVKNAEELPAGEAILAVAREC
jgi:hypothetical protein